MGKSCKAFIAAYKSPYVNCATCKYWDSEDFVCAEPSELAKRNKANEFDEMDKLMRQSKAVYIPPD